MSGMMTCLVLLQVQLIVGASYLLKEGVFIWNSQMILWKRQMKHLTDN